MAYIYDETGERAEGIYDGEPRRCYEGKNPHVCYLKKKCQGACRLRPVELEPLEQSEGSE